MVHQSTPGRLVKAVGSVALAGFVQFVAIAGALFLPSWTVHYWQAWMFLAVFACAAWLPSVYVQMARPAALQRRMRGGPVAEARTVQKVVMAVLYGSLAAMCVVSALDHRFGWSSVPAAVSVLGVAVVAAGLAMVVLVAVQNTYASTTVQVEAGQQVVSTGLYAVVRHPMYFGNVLMLVGTPPALGSYWALLFVAPGVLVLVSRIRDEETLLRDELAGYCDYSRRVRYRLVPCLW